MDVRDAVAQKTIKGKGQKGGTCMNTVRGDMVVIGVRTGRREKATEWDEEG